MDYKLPNETILKVRDLESIGIISEAVIVSYRKSAGVVLDLNELIKVSPKNEGKHINFETFDKISIVVPVLTAAGGWNKIE